MSRKPFYLSYTVNSACAGRTVEQILHRELRMPDGLISHLKHIPAGILLDDTPAHVTVRVRERERISVRIDDTEEVNPAVPVNCGVSISWEDEALAILYKPVGICVHGTPEGTPTVANAAAFLWGRQQGFHPVNRLDRGTSGLMVVAKCRYVHALLQSQLHTGSFQRHYLALTDGKMPLAGCVTAPLNGKDACTDYEALIAKKDFSLVRLLLHTGRTHQIREHLTGLGHPLVGDTVYGGTDKLSRPALHAASIRLVHPLTGEILICSAPLPPDMTGFLRERGISYVDEDPSAFLSAALIPDSAESPQT